MLHSYCPTTWFGKSIQAIFFPSVAITELEVYAETVDGQKIAALRDAADRLPKLRKPIP
jgi:hypothetical protein